MKKLTNLTIIVAICLILNSCSNSQNDNNEICKPTTISNFDLDEDEKAMQATYTNDQLTQLIGKKSKYTYQYDSQNRVVSKLYEEIGTQPSPETYKTIYIYGSNNKIIEEQFSQKIDATNFKILSRWEYTYDTNNHLKNGKYYYKTNNFELLRSSTTYYYSGENIVKIVVDEDQDQNNTPNYVYEYKISDDKQNPIEALNMQLYAIDTYINKDDNVFIYLPIYSNLNRVVSYTEKVNKNKAIEKNIEYLFALSPKENNLLSEIKINSNSIFRFTYNCF